MYINLLGLGANLFLYGYRQMSPEITSYTTYGKHNEEEGEYVGMSNAGWQTYDTLTDSDKVLLRNGLKMLMKQVFEDKKLDLPAINAMRSRSTKNDQCMCIESIKKQDDSMCDFVSKVTLGHHVYFIKLIHKTESYTPYHEHKAQDISRQLLGGEIRLETTKSKPTKIVQKLTHYLYNFLGYDGNKAYIRIAEPLYSFTKVKTDGFYDGFIIYPFEDNIKLLGDNDTLTKKYYTQIKNTLSLHGLMSKQIRDMHDGNISYKYDDNGSLIFTVFDVGLQYTIDEVHNLYPHAPRPPKPPRRTNT